MQIRENAGDSCKRRKRIVWSFPHSAMWKWWKTCLSDVENFGFSPSFGAFSPKVIHNIHKIKCGKLFCIPTAPMAKMRESERKKRGRAPCFLPLFPRLRMPRENIHHKNYESRFFGRKMNHARDKRQENKIPCGEAPTL